MREGLPWFKVSVDFFDRPDIRTLTSTEKCDLLTIVAYCARHATDGQFNPNQLKPRVLDKFVENRLVIRSESVCFLPEYCSQQMNKADIEKHRESQRIRKHRQRCHAVTTAVSPASVTPIEVEREVEREKEEDLKEIKKKEPSAQSAKADDAVQRIYAYWSGIWGQAYGPGSARLLLTQKRASKVRLRLAEGYTFTQVVNAIEGYFRSDFHLTNRYVDLELICRDAVQLDKGLNLYDKHRKEAGAAEARSEETQVIPGRLLYLKGVNNG